MKYIKTQKWLKEEMRIWKNSKKLWIYVSTIYIRFLHVNKNIQIWKNTKNIINLCTYVHCIDIFIYLNKNKVMDKYRQIQIFYELR